MTGWNALFNQARPAFLQQRSFERARTLGLSALTCLGRHTLSGLLCASGQQFCDWSAAYRLFERERLNGETLWRVPLRGVLETLPPAGPIVALIDDTLLRKRGRRIAGTSWRRDPLGPHFADNFIWASRFLQISLALPEHPEAPVSAARAIPVDLLHAPSPRKPSRRTDPAGPEWQSWRAASAASAISRQGAQRIRHLREAIDQFVDGTSRPLLVCADATFTNRTVLRDLPPRTTLLGRIRKDARLYALPTSEEENQGCGRRRCYGQRLPTPEQLRRDDSIPWKTVQAFAAGNVYDFDIKFITPLRWKNAGGERQLSLLIVRPVAYRLRQGAHLSYRNPAYLICSDPVLSPQKILQAYLWRWEIGVSREGHINQSVKVRPRLEDSSLVAWEAPWRESKTARPSDNILGKEYAQRTRLQRTVNADVASLHGNPVAETVDNARKQQELAEMSPMQQLSPAGYQRRHGVKADVSTGEALHARRRNLAEEALAITLSGKCRRRHQGDGSGRTTVDRRAVKHVWREGPGPVSAPFGKVRQG